jgi:hypothetical protein
MVMACPVLGSKITMEEMPLGWTAYRNGIGQWQAQ